MGISKCLFLYWVVVLGVPNMDEHPKPRPWAGKAKSDRLLQENKQYWLQKGEDELQEALSLQPNTNLAKNIILFIGDGMSLPTVAAARVYKGQQSGSPEGNSAHLSWEKLPHVGFSKTYDADFMVPDSAATAFAIYSGIKTTGYTMGYDNTVDYMRPGSALNATPVTTILDWAQEAGKKTGFVTTTRMSHATPAALYAKTVNRHWECENDIAKDIEGGDLMPEEVEKYQPKDITLQLVESEAGQKIDIMLGGGGASWVPRGELRWDYDTDDWNCTRADGRNLIEEWKGNHTGGEYVANRTELMAVDMKKTESVLGIFTNSYVTWDDLVDETNDKPRIVDMAVQAVKFLQVKSDDQGYFVMIEGGRIDHAHHNGQAVRALSEALAFDKAVEEVLKIVDLEDTLVVVTADHSHTMSMGGYNGREEDITGVVIEADGNLDLGEDGKPFTVLSYGNGPGFKRFNGTGVGDFKKVDRNPLEKGENAGMTYLQASPAPLAAETHGGDDVGIWAAGPMAHLFHGVHEQSYIGHVMSYAACVGPHKEKQRCINRADSGAEGFAGTFAILVFSILLTVFM